MNEYDLTEAGAFTEDDLLDFQQSELTKGKTIDKIWVTRLQANHLANSIERAKRKPTGKKLVDFWETPREPATLKSIHGIEIGIEQRTGLPVRDYYDFNPWKGSK